jgi:hypothetical protein
MADCWTAEDLGRRSGASHASSPSPGRSGSVTSPRERAVAPASRLEIPGAAADRSLQEWGYQQIVNDLIRGGRGPVSLYPATRARPRREPAARVPPPLRKDRNCPWSRAARYPNTKGAADRP